MVNEENDHLLKGKALQRHFDLNKALFEFHKLFAYDEPNDRAVVIIGASFLDTLLEHIILAFLPEDVQEVKEIIRLDQALGTYSSKVKIAYCLGLIDKVIKDDLKLVGKIRNMFAHDLFASFEDKRIESWCKELRWHYISMMMRELPDGATTRDLYQVGVNTLISHLNGCVSIAWGQKRQIRSSFPNENKP